MSLKTTAYLLALVIVAGFGQAVAQASITIQSIDILAVARVYASSSSQHYTDTILPTPAPVPMYVNRSEFGWFAESNNTVEFSENSGQTTLLITIDHHEMNGRAGAGILAGAGYTSVPGNDNANEQGTALRFTTSVDTPYELSGSYGMEGVGTIRQLAMLVDVGTNQVLFNNDQWSNQTTDEAFMLGGSGGDLANILSGSLTGQLLAGHTYEWYFAAYVGSLGGFFDGPVDDATGQFKLVLGEASDPGVVPEATSFLVWGLLGLTVACGGWKRRVRG